MRPFKTATELTSHNKARARLDGVFEQVDRHGDEHTVSPDEADTTIDATVDDVHSRTTSSALSWKSICWFTARE